MGGQETTLVWPVRYSGQIPNTRYSTAASDLRTQGIADLLLQSHNVDSSGMWVQCRGAVRGADAAPESAELGWG